MRWWWGAVGVAGLLARTTGVLFLTAAIATMGSTRLLIVGRIVMVNMCTT